MPLSIMGERCTAPAVFIVAGLLFFSLGLYLGWREYRFSAEGVPAEAIWHDASPVTGISAEYFEFTDAAGRVHKVQQMFFTFDPVPQWGAFRLRKEDPAVRDILLEGDRVNIEYLESNPSVARRRFEESSAAYNFILAAALTIAGLMCMMEPFFMRLMERE